MTRAARSQRRILFALALGASATLLGCEQASGPTRSSDLSVNVSVPSLSASGPDGIVATGVEIVVGQTRAGGDFATFGRATVPPSGFGQRVPVPTKLACGSPISCTVSVRLRLIGAGASAPFDSSDVGPITMAGGQTPEVGGFAFRRPVRLQMLDSVITPAVGQSLILRVRLLDAAGGVLSGRTVAFGTSDPTVATVDADGRVTGVRQGRAVISATRDGLVGTATVWVNGIPSDLTVNASVPALSASGPDGIVATSAELVVGQTRAGGSFATYGRVTVPSSAFGTRVPVATRLDCGSPISCTVSVRLRLSASGAVAPFDSSDIGPYTMANGQAPEVSGFVFRRPVRLQVIDTLLTPAVGQAQLLRVRLLDAAGGVLAGRPVVFSSSDPTVATVDAEGRVTGVRQGRAVISAERDGLQGATSNVWVNGVPTGLTVNVGLPALSATGPEGIVASGAEIVVGQTRAGGSFASFGRAAVAASSFGQRVPVATRLDCGSPISCTVSVRLRLSATGATAPFDSADIGAFTMANGQAPEVSGFVFRRTSRVQVLDSVLTPSVGQVQTMRVRLLDAAGAALAGRIVTYSSSDASVATVDTGGRVTGVRPGRAVVTASRDGQTGTASVAVNAVASFTLTASATRVTATVPVRLTATLSVPAGTNRRVLYRSSDTAVATVDTGGVVTTRREGTVALTAIADVDTTQRRTVTITIDPYRAATSWRYQIAAERAPFADHIGGLWGQRSDSVFAVTCNGGFVRRWDGTAWQAVTQLNFCARHIAGTSSRNIVVVGNGQIWRYDGTAWARENVTFPGNLEWASAAELSVFAVGTGGLIMRRDPSGWTTMPSGTTRDIRTVSAWSSTEAWAAGDGRTVLRLVNGAWQQATGLPSSLTDCAGVYMRGPRDVFVSCFENSYGWAIYRWDGSGWTRMDNTVYRQRQWSFFPVEGTLFAVGEEGMVMRLDGETWRIDAPQVGESRMTGGFGDRNGAVVVGWHGVSYARRAGRWELVSHIPSYRGLWGDGSGNLIGVGVQGAIDRFDGTRWSVMRPGGGQGLLSVWGASSNTIFASGFNGTLLRFDGGNWQTLPSPTTAGIPSVWGARADSVWAVTYNGEILFYNGSSWQLQFRTGRALRSIHGLDARSVWAVGDEGRIWKFDGRFWTREESSSEASLAGVLAVGDRVFAAGGTELLERRDGAWRTTGSFAGQNYFWLAGTNPRDIYAGGCGATVRRFDGTAWNTETNVSTCTASAFAPPGGGVVIGGFFRDLVIGTSPNGASPGSPR
jgi:uncharacterized protein YjdB